VGHAVVPAAREIVPAVNRLAAAVRATGGGVFWVKMTHDERCLNDWSVAFELATPEMREKRIAALTEGSLGHELWPELDVRPEDEIVRSTATAPSCRGRRSFPTGCARGPSTPW